MELTCCEPRVAPLRQEVEASPRSRLQLETRVTPTTLQHLLSPFNTTITIIILGQDFPPISKFLCSQVCRTNADSEDVPSHYHSHLARLCPIDQLLAHSEPPGRRCIFLANLCDRPNNLEPSAWELHDMQLAYLLRHYRSTALPAAPLLA